MVFVMVLGRILFALIFLASGIAGHLVSIDDTAAYAESRGFRNRALIQLSGVLIAAGALGVILGIWMDLAALGLALYSLIGAFIIHHFWTDEMPTQAVEMSLFMKNISMAGAGLILFALAGGGQDVGPQLVDTLFSFDL